MERTYGGQLDVYPVYPQAMDDFIGRSQRSSASQRGLLQVKAICMARGLNAVTTSYPTTSPGVIVSYIFSAAPSKTKVKGVGITF